MNKLEKMLKDLLEKTVTNKKGIFNSKYIYKRLKIKDKDLMNIISHWIDTLIDNDMLELVNIGKDKNGDNIYMTTPFFEEVIKKSLLNLDFIVDENTTYSFFNTISDTVTPNTEMLIKKIQQVTYPLVKFDKGSRNVPIMLNLFKIFVPERMINISEMTVSKINLGSENLSESKRVKKMTFNNTNRDNKDYGANEIILTALSYILKETEKLILSKEEIINSRGFKVFFNAPDFHSFSSLVEKIYPFSPFINNDFISFYPENWLDITQIKKQISQENPVKFLKRNFDFLDKNEIYTLLILLNIKHVTIKKINENSRKAENHEELSKNNEEKNKPQNGEKRKEKSVKDSNVFKSQKEESQKQKKPQKSEPLKFLNEIIYKEKEKTGDASEKQNSNKFKENKPITNSWIDNIQVFDNQEKHYLLRILDSTKVENGYYSHSIQDEKFGLFVKKFSLETLFKVNESNGKYNLSRRFSPDDNCYKILNDKLEESILQFVNKENSEHQQLKSTQDELKPSFNKESETDTTPEIKNESLLDNLLLEDDQKSGDQKHNTQSLSVIQEDHQESLIIDKDTESFANTSEDFNMDDIDHESFFEVSNDFDHQSEKKEKKDGQEDSAFNFQNKEIKKDLNGRVISVLTEDQEKWLKIKLLSEQIGFELRDGLAYKPEIAVFDEGFTHLEPIAKNSGAIILPIDEFMSRLGLRDKN